MPFSFFLSFDQLKNNRNKCTVKNKYLWLNIKFCINFWVNFGDFGFQTKHPRPEPDCLTPWKPWTYFDLYHLIFLCVNKFYFIEGKFNEVANLLKL